MTCINGTQSKEITALHRAPCFFFLFSLSLLIKMTVPAPFLNFLPGFSHSALPWRAVLWMTSLKAFICLQGKCLLTHPLWESEFTFQRNLSSQYFVPESLEFSPCTCWLLLWATSRKRNTSSCSFKQNNGWLSGCNGSFCTELFP